MSVTHVTGPPVNINGRVIQRCVICGEKLMDSRGSMMPLLPDGRQPEFLVWKERHYLHCDGPRQKLGVDFTTSGIEDPDDLCIDLVE